MTETDYISVTCNSPSYNFSGLTQLTQYNVRLKAVCGANNESDFIVTTFTTTQSGQNTYIITATAGANGAISPSGQISVLQGGSQTFTITPDTDYTVSDVWVDDVSQGTITSYSFTNVQSNHTISVTFVLGINENDLQNSIVIFPNPANDVLNVKLSQQFERVDVTNMLGQVLYSNKLTDTFFRINISSYASGVYFIRLQDENGMVTKKFLKE